MERQNFNQSSIDAPHQGAVEYSPLHPQMYGMTPGQALVSPFGPIQTMSSSALSHLWPSDAHMRQFASEGSDRHLDAYTSHSISIWGEDYPPIHMGPLEYSEAVDRDTEETLEDLLGPFPALRLRGLPFDAGVRDVITFFHGMGVLDVVMTSKGECIVLFNTLMDMQLGLGKDRQNMGRRYIEIFVAKRVDYYHAVRQRTEEGYYRRLHFRGDVHGFAWRTMRSQEGSFHDFNAALFYPNQPYQHPQAHLQAHTLHRALQMTPYQQPSYQTVPGAGLGPATTGLADTERPGETGKLAARQGQNVAAPTIPREVAIAATERAQNSGILKLRGLPFTCSNTDIRAFFEGFTVLSDDIQLILRADGRLTGEAFVSFSSVEDARSAQQSKDRSMLGTRYVELFHTTPEELARALNGQQHIAGSSAVCIGSSSAKTSESADSEISTSGRGEALSTLEA